MKIEVRRIAERDTYTIGRLYVDGTYFCDTLEDKVRDLAKEKKVYGKTAIPSGTYRVTLNVRSPRFASRKQYAFCNGYLPRLLDVPDFEGVLIHIGNTAEDTEGCILVGKNTAKGMVTESTATFRALYDRLRTSADGITLTIG